MFGPALYWYDRRCMEGRAMGQVLHGGATTTEAVRRAIQVRQGGTKHRTLLLDHLVGADRRHTSRRPVQHRRLREPRYRVGAYQRIDPRRRGRLAIPVKRIVAAALPAASHRVERWLRRA